jgi:hypothetical protein
MALKRLVIPQNFLFARRAKESLCGIRFGFFAEIKPNRIPDQFSFAARRENRPE